MGCFSFLCLESGKPINSSSFGGDPVHLFLLRKGEVIEYMYGNYDSYGRVFTGKQDPDRSDTFETSFIWGGGDDADYKQWLAVCALMSGTYDGSDMSSGIAAIHGHLWTPMADPWPTRASASDPNQGWGDSGELMSSTGSDGFGILQYEPRHEIYKALMD